MLKHLVALTPDPFRISCKANLGVEKVFLQSSNCFDDIYCFPERGSTFHGSCSDESTPGHIALTKAFSMLTLTLFHNSCLDL